MKYGLYVLSLVGAFVMGAEIGLELYKQKYLQIGVAVRGLAIFGDKTDAALHTQLGFEVPF